MKKKDYWLWGIFLLALFLRLYHIGNQSLWSDEAYDLWVGQQNFDTFKTTLFYYDNHPPLFFSFLWGWEWLLKQLHWPLSEANTRFPFALFSCFQVIILYQLAKYLWGDKVAKLSAFCLAISASHIIIGQEIKMYSLLGLFSLGSVFFLYRWLNERKTSCFYAYILFTVLALYTHYHAFILLALEELYLIGFIKKISFRHWFYCQLLLLLSYLPWLPVFLLHLKHHKNVILETPGSLHNFFDTFLILFHGYPIHITPWNIFYLGLLTFLFIGLFSPSKSLIPSLKAEWLLYPIVFLPVAVMTLLSCIPPYTLYTPRQMIYLLPFFLLLWIKSYPHFISKILLMTFLILNLFSLGQWYYNPECQRAHWNQVGKYSKKKLSQRTQ